MSIRTVRLDPKSEELMTEIQEASGLSVTATLKRALVVLHERYAAERSARPWDIYKKIELGSGGDSRAHARSAKRSLPSLLEKKHRR